jgi:cholesterol oxidase
MGRLSSRIEDRERRYDVVVVGSGYGGGIAASRLARAGRSVCVLERGKELQPGEYRSKQLGAVEEMQLELEDHRVGSRTGLYDLRFNGDFAALVACGLGGTSLINANVALEPEPRVFENPVWPAPPQHCDRRMLRPV